MTRAERILIEDRWHCPYCDTFYAEYVNGCPRCYMGEAGTSTSVVCVKAVLTYDGWRKATDKEVSAVKEQVTHDEARED